jgi:myo-inositol-1(or 4)-monophosphatase
VSNASADETLRRIQEALGAAVETLDPFLPGSLNEDYETSDDPVTEVDRPIGRVLRDILVRNGQGQLSEKSPGVPGRLGKSRVWKVDPLDGTNEFLGGIRGWCVSVGLSEGGKPVAGGISNPPAGELNLRFFEARRHVQQPADAAQSAKRV